MEFNRIWVLRGPNVWARTPMVEAEIDFGEYRTAMTASIPGLAALLSTCQVPNTGGIHLAHALHGLTVRLQALAGDEFPDPGLAEEVFRDGLSRVVFPYREEELARGCLEAARRGLLAVIRGEAFDFPAEAAELRDLAERVRVAPGSAAVAEAAERRGIPVRRLTPEGLLLLGHGARQRREPGAGIGRLEASARPVGAGIVDYLFPPGETGRIPVVAVTGVNGKTTTTRLIAHLLREAGLWVGMTCTDGLYFNGTRTATYDCSGPQSAREVLLDPRVEAAVLETARGGILREGLGFDRCAVGVVTNVGHGDHFGLRGINTLEQLARVKRVVVEAVAPDGQAVLNAADPLVAGMAPCCPGGVTFFARDDRNSVVAAHRRGGGRAVFVRDGAVVLAEGPSEVVFADLAEVPATREGKVGFQVENVLAAVGAAWALGGTPDRMRAALATFTGDDRQVPGRFNVLETPGGTVVIDYAHNPSAVAALVEALDGFPHSRRTLVFSGCNRRDEDVIAMGESAGRGFDRIILYPDWGNSGRTDGELNALFRRGAAAGGRVREVIEAAGEFDAIERALADLRAGELLVIGVVSIEEACAHVRAALAGHPPAV